MKTIIFVTFLALSVATCMEKSQTTNINLKPTLLEALDNPTIGRQLKDFGSYSGSAEHQSLNDFRRHFFQVMHPLEHGDIQMNVMFANSFEPSQKVA